MNRVHFIRILLAIAYITHLPITSLEAFYLNHHFSVYNVWLE